MSNFYCLNAAIEINTKITPTVNITRENAVLMIKNNNDPPFFNFTESANSSIILPVTNMRPIINITKLSNKDCPSTINIKYIPRRTVKVLMIIAFSIKNWGNLQLFRLNFLLILHILKAIIISEIIITTYDISGYHLQI
jgi:hypothetical protein